MTIEDDDVELSLSVGIHEGTVIIHFGTQVRWIGLGPELAIEVAEAIIKHAKELQEAKGISHDSH